MMRPGTSELADGRTVDPVVLPFPIVFIAVPFFVESAKVTDK